MRTMRGAISFNRPTHLLPSAESRTAKPVMLLPGCAMLAAKPPPIGSIQHNRIGSGDDPVGLGTQQPLECSVDFARVSGIERDGGFRLLTSPKRTGSPPIVKTTGTVGSSVA